MHIDSFPKIRLLFVLFAVGVLSCAPRVKGDWSTTSRFRFQWATHFADQLNTGRFGKVSSSAAWAFRSGDGTNFDYFFDRTFGVLSAFENNEFTGAFYREANFDVFRDHDIFYPISASGFTSSTGWPATHDSLPTLRLKNHDLIITCSGQTTLSFWNFIIKGGTLTLQGAVGTNFTINVRNDFRLSDSAKIVLSGGLQPSDVSFNIIGQGWPVVIRQQSSLSGSIQAFQRTALIIGNSDVIGNVTASKVELSGGGNITPPPVVSP
jgi:hypothetical protein